MAAAVEEAPYGGYDYTFVNGDLPSSYYCHICTLVSRDPHQVSCCYNIFCKSCLIQYQKKGSDRTCPTCRKPLSTRSYFKDGRLEREIKSLKIYCTSYGKSDCQWKGAVNDIESHIKTCPYQMVHCSNGCGEKIQKSEMEAHLSESCPKRIINCQYCRREGPHNLITSTTHTNECSSYPVRCCHEGCDEVQGRFLLSGHEKSCPKAFISCEYSSVGCNKIIKRKDQEKHNEESVTIHLQLAMKRVDDLQMRCSSAPVVLKMNDAWSKQRNNEVWYSPPFYTSPGGYKMMLCIYASGCGSGKGTHVSCYTHLVPGEYDAEIEWPFQGEVTVELLNTKENNNHKKTIIKYSKSTPKECKERVEKYRMSKGWGIEQFVAHSDFKYKGGFSRINYCRFFAPSYFRVSVKVCTETKPWLV